MSFKDRLQMQRKLERTMRQAKQTGFETEYTHHVYPLGPLEFATQELKEEIFIINTPKPDQESIH